MFSLKYQIKGISTTEASNEGSSSSKNKIGLANGTCKFCKENEIALCIRTSKSKNRHTLACEKCDEFICKFHSVVLLH